MDLDDGTRVLCAGGRTPEELLAEIVAADRVAERLQVEQHQRIVEWADAHVVDDEADAATEWADVLDTGVPIAGPGAPLVSDFALQGLCAARGRSFESGRAQVGRTVELAWRLPQIWARVRAYEVPVWKALRVAELTRSLSEEAAEFVDQHIHPVLGTCTWAQIDRTVAEAVRRHDPDRAERERREAADHRHLTVDTDAPSNLAHGLTPVYGLLDAADARDLDTALGRRAEVLGRYGADASLDVRRSIAAGEMARADLVLDLEHVDETTGEVTRAAAGRSVVLHVHLSDAAVHASATPAEGAVGRVGETGRPVSAEQVREWCGLEGTRITVRPVIDLAEHVPVDSYEIPDRVRDRVEERDHLCAYPHCGRKSARCDLDHAQPYAAGGVTCPCNLVPLCRRHHRLKTHAFGWRYVIIQPGAYLWLSPDGLRWLVDHRGTHALDPPRSFDHDHDPPDWDHIQDTSCDYCSSV